MITARPAFSVSRATLLATLGGLAFAWIALDLLVWGYGDSPLEVVKLLFEGTWGSAYGIGQVLFKATPILFTGIAVDLALRVGLFNIGAEGQLMMGSLAAGVVGASLPPGTPSFVAIPCVLSAAALAGGAWAALPAWLKVRFFAHEVISTIMMNRIADAVVSLVLGLGFARAGTVRTEDVVAGARLARLGDLLPSLRGSAVSTAAVFAIGCGVLMAAVYRRTRFGREVILVGKNPAACAAERIPVKRRIVQAMIVSGAVCGVASSATVLGYKGYFESGLGAEAGFGGVAVALLGRGDPLGLVFAALLFGTLQQGGLAINAHVPMEMMEVLQGVVILAVALADTRVRAMLARPFKGAK